MARRWQADASVGDITGVYDAAYAFGGDSRLVGTPAEIAAELQRYLESLSDEDIEAMKYGSNRFLVRLEIMVLPPAR
jgi:hypothetical protein